MRLLHKAGDLRDLALARLSKRGGFKTAIYGGASLYSARMYTGSRTLWPGVTKNLTEMLGGQGAGDGLRR